ncbi:MAG: ACT domain-containing protein [Polyangiales bacterium]
MSGDDDLQRLLRTLSPDLAAEAFVFVSLPGARYGDHVELSPVASVEEREGLTLIVPKDRADEFNVAYEGVFRRISLRAHSSLEACGLSAAISGALAEQGLSANIVAGALHDHIFVPNAQAGQALEVLRQLSGSA